MPKAVRINLRQSPKSYYSQIEDWEDIKWLLCSTYFSKELRYFCCLGHRKLFKKYSNHKVSLAKAFCK